MTQMGAVTERTVPNLIRKNLPVCVLDDEPDMVELTAAKLEKMGFPAIGTMSPDEALQQIRGGLCRVVLVNMKLQGMDGLAFLEKSLHFDPGVYVILITEFYSVDSAIEAVKRGAYDYLCKPIDDARLLKSLDELAELFTQRKQIRKLEEQLLSNLEFYGIVSKSPAMLEVFDLARKIAK